jgi:hypothetical protein
MPFNIEKLDAEIRRLQMIRELANDPEAREALERFVTPNGHTEKPAESALALEPPKLEAQPPKRTYGLMAKHALELLNSTPQSAQDIAAQMMAQGFEFTADPKTAISDVLRGLEQKKQVKRNGKGKYGVSLWVK